MEQQEEKTVLILGEENNSVPKAESLSDDDFSMVLKDSCGDYTIITSIKDLTYRIEIFREDELEDAIEIVCDTLEREPLRERLFKDTYKQAHQKYTHMFCPKTDDIAVQEAVPEEVYPLEEMQVEHTLHLFFERLAVFYKNIKRRIHAKGYDPRVVLTGVLIGIVVLFVFMGRILMCSDTVIALFLKGEDKISFYAQTEPFCHKLEKGCMALSQMNLEQETLLSPKACRTWCKKKIISKEKCALFLPYFPQQKELLPVEDEFEKPVIQNEVSDILKQETVKEAYSFSPKGEIILQPQKYFELFIENHTDGILKVAVKDLILNESEHEEIIQFRGGVSSLLIDPERKKSFKIFLEQTYYEQFEKGNYTGKMVFLLVFADGKEQKIEKTFSFKVE